MRIYENKECNRIELSSLLKYKQIQKGKILSSSIHWTNSRGEDSGSIDLIAAYTEDDKYLRFKYQSTHGRTKEVKQMDYKVQLVEVPSNLGKGNVLYMECPSYTGRMCRILYCAYNTHKFYSREYFNSKGYRIYYPSQARCKDDYLFKRKHNLEREYDNFWKGRRKQFYFKGNPTKRYLKYLKLENDFYSQATKCDLRVHEVINKLKSNLI